MRMLPATAFAVGLAGVALIGLPPSGTFISKWILLRASLVSGQWWWAPVVLAGTLLASAYVFRLLANAFAPLSGEGAAPAAASGAGAPLSVGAMAQAPALLMTLVAVLLLGLGADPLWTLLQDPAP